MSPTMRQVAITGLGAVEPASRPRPEPAAGEALVATHLAGICGSDTHAVAGLHPLLRPPYLPGHEIVGEVAALGAGSSGPAIGTRVIVKPNVTCGTCVNCLAGRSNACQDLRWIGCDPSGQLPGGMAEYVLAPAENLFVVPDDVTDDEAVLVECLATPVHAARIAGDLTGARVAVLGGGTIGLFAVIAAASAGAGRIVLTDLDPSKRDRALRHGAVAAFDPSSPSLGADVAEALGGPADVVFDCVAIAPTIAQGIGLLRHAGTLLIVGVPQGDVSLPMPSVQDWELRIQGCANYTGQDIETALGLARDGKLPAGEIISGRYAIADAAAAFARAESPDSGKVVIDPRL